jgi:hypothetical protein
MKPTDLIERHRCNGPTHFPQASPEGPWGVVGIGDSWYVMHKTTRRMKRIGRVIGFKPVSVCNPDYWGRALDEAHRRNCK